MTYSDRLADDQARHDEAAVDAPAEQDEWEGIDEHPEHGTPTQSGPHL